MDKQIDTPIVFIIFNRPEQTLQVWSLIKSAKPRELFIIADAPREDNVRDLELCRQCRELVEDIDWPCDVRRNYATENMGCGRRIASGLDWVFEQVEEAIILEDDCVPSKSFFLFCEEMLNKYRDNEDVWAIQGTNYRLAGDDGVSYYFSHYFATWGWATWCRAWQKYDWYMQRYQTWRDSEACRKILPVKVYRDYWLEIFDRYFNKLQMGEKLTAWSYQFYLTVLSHEGLVLYPNKNLVANIGYGEDATHTKGINLATNYEYQSTRIAEELDFPLVHPASVQPDHRMDCLMMEKIYLPSAEQRDRVADNVVAHLLEAGISSQTALIVYGAGMIGRVVVRQLVKMGIDDFYLAVTESPTQETMVDGVPVRSLTSLQDYKDTATVILATAKDKHPSLVDNLQHWGFSHWVIGFDLF